VSDHPDPPGPDEETLDAPAGSELNERIGRYRLLQRLGEGGFGQVFLAEQTEPVRRQVALKIIKLGMDTREVVARFEQERQALAIMDHPHIARVLDAGATDTGRPYFVMDLVKGEPITAFCDRHAMPLADRLKLAEQVCLAVQHAHQKGLIHRDLKPSNILVAMQDGRPQPKIIDFGIAKATGARLTEHTVFTAQFTLVGTPEYMSPEQAAGSLDIDTRTDIYSLGVLLYELITGTTPLTTDELRGASFADIQRRLREDEPPSPSRRLTQSTDTLARVAARRSIEPRRLSLAVRGELDWIVQKAIHKDPAQRYETANALAQDIRRYLDGHAVLAAPPGTAYRVKKFVGRHRRAVAAAVVVAAALLLGIAGTLWQASIAARERDAAKREAANAQAVTDFVVESLKSQDPTSAGRQDMTVAEAMRQAATQLSAGALQAQPETVGVLQRTIATVLEGNGKSTEAMPFAQQALTLERGLHPGDHVHVADALSVVGDVAATLGQYAESETTLRAALDMHRRLHPGDSKEVESVLNDLGTPLLRLGRFDDAARVSEDALAMSRRLVPPDDRNVAIALNGLGMANKGLGKLDKAEALYTEALPILQRLHPGDHPDVATLLANIGSVRRSLGRYPEAVQMSEEALAMNRRLFKGDNMTTAAILMNLGVTLQALHRFDEAEARSKEVLQMLDRLFPGDHALKARTLDNLASIQLDAGRPKDAQASAGAAAAMSGRVFSGDNTDVVDCLGRLAQADAKLRQWAAALTHAQQAAEMAARLAPNGSPARTKSEETLAKIKQQAAGAGAGTR
jgi:tetratricopeptide (TPR) repeat protein